MRVLFLDDDDDRHRAFQRNAIGHELVAVYSYDAAAEVLAKLVAGEIERFEQMFLDHDLSWNAAMGAPLAEEKTGRHVAELVAALPIEKRPDHVVIHSFNDAGARAMHRILYDAGFRGRVLRSPFNGRRTRPIEGLAGA